MSHDPHCDHDDCAAKADRVLACLEDECQAICDEEEAAQEGMVTGPMDIFKKALSIARKILQKAFEMGLIESKVQP